MPVPSKNVSENLMASADLTDDEYYRLLDSRRRRVLLSVLAERDDSVSVGELARRVAEAESEDDAFASVDATSDIRIDLHHVHLPMLDDHGVVEYDWTARRVHA